MASIIQRPNSGRVVLHSQIHKHHTVEKIASESAELYGFKEIRLPADQSISDLGTTAENFLADEMLPLRIYYMRSALCCEILGSDDAKADAEIISLAKDVIDVSELKNIRLNINSVGCHECRAEYHKTLRNYFNARKNDLCSECRENLGKDVLKIFECGSPQCKALVRTAPVMADMLCSSCKTHFEQLQGNLSLMDINFEITSVTAESSELYEKTVFEFVADGEKRIVCGGGRVDSCDKKTPSVRLEIDIESFVSVMEKQKCDFMAPNTCDIYIAAVGQKASDTALRIAKAARDEGYFAEYDLMNRDMTEQLEYAERIGAKFVLPIGDEELASGVGVVRNTAEDYKVTVKLDNSFIESFNDVFLGEMFKDIDGGITGLFGKE